MAIKYTIFCGFLLLAVGMTVSETLAFPMASDGFQAQFAGEFQQPLHASSFQVATENPIVAGEPVSSGLNSNQNGNWASCRVAILEAVFCTAVSCQSLNSILPEFSGEMVCVSNRSIATSGSVT